MFIIVKNLCFYIYAINEWANSSSLVFSQKLSLLLNTFFVLLLEGRFKRLLFELVYEKKAETQRSCVRCSLVHGECSPIRRLSRVKLKLVVVRVSRSKVPPNTPVNEFFGRQHTNSHSLRVSTGNSSFILCSLTDLHNECGLISRHITTRVFVLCYSSDLSAVINCLMCLKKLPVNFCT